MASAPPSVEEGFDDERFQTAVPQNLHCAICLNVFRKPMQCVRNEHSFCKPCITRYLRDTPRCPTCIEPLTLATLRPSRLVTDLLSQLMIRCDNFHRGCPESVKMETLEAHVQNCDFSPVHCSNEGCEVIINRKDQADHEINDCDHRRGKCEVCGKQVAYGKRKLHCYVTRNEVHNLTHEISSVKEVVTNLSQQLTRHMTDVKAGMDDMNRRMNNLERVVNENTKKLQSIKQEPQIHIRPSGSGATSSEENPSFRSDVIIAGGNDLNSVEVFSWTTRQWTLLPEMTSERCFSSSFVYRGHMYVCGGMWSGDSMEVLQLGQRGARWKNFPAKLPHTINGHTCVVYEDSLLILGGRSVCKPNNNIYKISLVAPYSSQVVGHMPEPRADHGAHCFDDKVYIVGGTTTGHSCDSLNTVLVYDITNNCCQTLAPLPFAVCDMATVAWKDNIIILAGLDKNGNELNTVVKYNVTNEKSKMLPSMRHKRSVCSAVVTGNVIVVMGGIEVEELRSVECFSFDLYKWEELPAMNEYRGAATAVVKCV